MSRRWPCSLAALLFLFATACGAAEEAYYSFELDGKSIGFAEMGVDEVTLDGRKVERLRSVTTLKFALSGSTRTTVRRSVTLVDPQTSVPIHFELTQDVNGSVTHVESKMEGSQAQTWQWEDGAPKGDPQETDLPAGAMILGSNNFAHWNLLTAAAADKAVDGTATFQVFLPDEPQIQPFRLVRGKTRELTINGTSRTSQVWTLQGAGIELCVEPKTGQLLQMALPAQKTTVTLADKSVVTATQQEGPPDILAIHFTPSNVSFDEFLKVRAMTAKIDVAVIGTGVTNALSVLTTPMQQFNGTKDNERITGTVTIASLKRTASDSPPFPMPGDTPAEMQPWLDPEPLIESDDPAIVAQARELTADAADRWQAVVAVAEWVSKNIAYKIADSPSARMALEKRVGDCGPHSTLTVAMLRSVGIPARLVGGLVYTPSMGGSFGQHAWVEVHLGDEGWLAFDPTTGEIDTLSATHIKLFEGMGGVIPRKVEVVAYEPPNREPTQSELPLKPLSWKRDKDYTYTYVQNGTELGTQRFRISDTQVAGQPAFRLDSNLDLTAQGTRVQATTQIVLHPNATPISFSRSFLVRGTEVVRKGEFQDGSVHISVTGPTELTKDVKVPAGTYFFDNNLIPCFSMICSQLELKPNSEISVRTFHPGLMNLLTLSFQIKELKKVTVGEQEVECFECLVEPIKNTFWITPDGRLLKVEATGLAITVSPID